MRHRLTVIAGVFAVSGLALSACAGGGGAGGYTPASSLAGQQDPPSLLDQNPTAAPAAISAPSALTFAGSLNRSDTYTYPQPNPLPPDQQTANVTQLVKVTSTSNPISGISGPVSQYTNNESDAYPLQTLQSTTTSYYRTESSAFQLLGYTIVDSGNTSRATTVYAFPQKVYPLPLRSGTWTNSPVALTKATGQNINYSDHTTYSNGSYTEEDQYYGNTKNYPAIHVELYQRPDGRSAFNLTRYENGNKNFPPGFALQENYFITGPTASSPTGLPALFLSFTTNYPGPTPPPTPNIPNELAVWYPLNASGQPALHSETNVNRGLQPLPGACKVPSSFGTSAFEVVQTIKDLDTILGTVTTTTTTQWVASKFGTVCVQLASTVNEWYDYNSDTFVAPVVFQSDRPLQTTVIKETVGL
ncbi:MAG TPA: hypothetical protein VGN11_09825, partial [Candidatus Baltobacteraceae bacterium]|nr:hypothetical protein [Candidatus Baltobacteraceae bacterium]